MTTAEIVDSAKSMVNKVGNLRGTIFYRITCEVAVFVSLVTLPTLLPFFLTCLAVNFA